MKHKMGIQVLVIVLMSVLGAVGMSAQASDLLVGSFNSHDILRYDQQTGSFINQFANNVELENPAGMVFGPDGHLYVAGQKNGNVVRFDGQTGTFIDEFVLPGDGGLFLPTFLTFGPDGNLYVSSFTDQVLRFNGTTGAFMDVFAEGHGLDDPFGMAFGPDGNFYVASFRSDEVLRFDGATGAFIDVFASASSSGFPPSGSFTFPSALVFGPDQQLYVVLNSSIATTGVFRFDGQTGAFIDEFVSAGSGGLVSSIAMLFGPDGHLYVSDFLGASEAGSVRRYDGLTGAFIDKFVSAPSGGLDAASGLAFFPTVKPKEIWSKQEGTTGKDSATAVAVGDGLYVAGVTTGTLPGQNNSGGQDAFLRKYDLNGNVVCTDQFGTSGDENISGIKVTDTAVYVNGDTTGVFAGQSPMGGDDLFVRQYDLNCQANWTKQFGTTGQDTASSGLGLTPDGTSLFAGGITDPGSGGDTDAFVQRLDISGNLGCNNQFGTFGNERGGIVLNSPAVSFAVTTDGGAFGGSDGFVTQFSLGCTENWRTSIGTVVGDEIVSGLGVGPDDNLPEGVFVGSTTTAAYAGFMNAGESDFVLQRYNFATGVLDWTRQFGTGLRETGGIVLNSPFVWMSGTTTGAFSGFDNAGGTDIVIRKYDLDGNELYTTQFGTDEDDQILAMAHTADASSLFVVGDTMGAFAGESNQGGQDFFVKKFEVTSDPIVLLKALKNLVKGADIRHGLKRRLVKKLKIALHGLEHLQEEMEPSYSHSGHDHWKPNHHRVSWWRCFHHHSPKARCHNHDDAAITQKALTAFIRMVERQSGKNISETDANRFIADAQTILELVNGN